MEICSKFVLHQAPFTNNIMKYTYGKSMCIQTIKRKALIKSSKGVLREATQHYNNDLFPHVLRCRLMYCSHAIKSSML